MSLPLFTIAGLANHELVFQPTAAQLGFTHPADIDRFIFSVYGKALRETPAADRPRGTIFVLEPAATPEALGNFISFRKLLNKIQTETTETFYAVGLDLAGELTAVYACTPQDRTQLAAGGWPQKVAQRYSRATAKCVVWATGVSVHVYLNGDLYLESVDVIEGLALGVPGNFQSLSWDDGGIVFEFARHRLNDTSPGGIWHLPERFLLRPKPEVLIRSRLGEFLRFRLAGYHHHDEEPLVEHEGRADISLHLIDDRVLIIEVKWLGCSLVATRIGEKEAAVKQAMANNTKGWLTRFDDRTIASGVKQLVIYYKTGRYRRAYLAIFDCANSATATDSCDIPVPEEALEGHNVANFRILRAKVDPRSASRRARS